jgi:hypothetical protein
MISISGGVRALRISIRVGVAVALLSGLSTASPARAASAPPFAAVHIDNAAATRRYLRASDAYIRDLVSGAAASVAAIERRASEIATECPSALTYAPRDAAFSQLSEEAAMTLLFAGAEPVRSIMLRLVGAIKHLRWSDRRLTRLVRTRAAEERAIATFALPDVCTAIEAWKASAYAALPQSASEFLAHVEAIPFEESRETAILHMLKRYEGSTERRTAKRIEVLEARGSKRLTSAATAAQARLAAALGVSAL